MQQKTSFLQKKAVEATKIMQQVNYRNYSRLSQSLVPVYDILAVWLCWKSDDAEIQQHNHHRKTIHYKNYNADVLAQTWTAE
jgi:hypothetical protein